MHLCTVEGIQAVTRSKPSNPGVNSAQERNNGWDTEGGPECTSEQLEALKQTLPEGLDVEVATANHIRQRAEQIMKKDGIRKKCGRDKCKNPPGCFSFRKRAHDKGSSLYHIMGCPPDVPKPRKNPPKKDSATTPANASVVQVAGIPESPIGRPCDDSSHR